MLSRLSHNFIFIFLGCISVSVSELSLDIDQCEKLCSDNDVFLPLLSWGDDSQVYCQTGCRFSNIIDSTDDQSWNVTQKECYISCSESYLSPRENKSCTMGCDLMMKKKRFTLQKSPQIREDDFDSLEGDIFLDPMIRHQLEKDLDIKFKIPEAYIRTMPIDDKNVDIMKEDNGFKLELSCSSIAQIAIFCVIVCALIISTVKIIQLVRKLRFSYINEDVLLKAPISEGLMINEKKSFCTNINKDDNHDSACEERSAHSTVVNV